MKINVVCPYCGYIQMYRFDIENKIQDNIFRCKYIDCGNNFNVQTRVETTTFKEYEG